MLLVRRWLVHHADREPLRWTRIQCSRVTVPLVVESDCVALDDDDLGGLSSGGRSGGYINAAVHIAGYHVGVVGDAGRVGAAETSASGPVGRPNRSFCVNDDRPVVFFVGQCHAVAF